MGDIPQETGNATGLLANFEGPVFPKLASSSGAQKTTAPVFEALDWTTGSIDPTTLVCSAWAILQARYTYTSDTVFEVAHPEKTRFLVRLDCDWDLTVSDFLAQAQAHAQAAQETTSRPTREQDSLQYRPNTLLAITSRDDVFVEPDVASQTHGLSGSPTSKEHDLTLRCTVYQNGMALKIRHDDASVPTNQATRMASQMMHVLRELLAQPQAKLGEISLASKEDLADIFTWNATVPKVKPALVHSLIAKTVAIQPDSLAVNAWDGDLTYQQLDDLSSRLASRLSELGVCTNAIVTLCLEKSMWMPVAQMAVMKAGGASVGLDINQPPERLRTIMAQARPKVSLCSNNMFHVVSRLGPCTTISIDTALMESLPTPSEPEKTVSAVKPADLLCVVFTSGSTGTPKGATLTHSNFSTALPYHTTLFEMGPKTRLYDFASYSFDVLWENTLAAFSSGACLCIPSESERKNDLERSLARFQATMVWMTPSLARTIDWSAVPKIEVLACVGEAVPKFEVPEHVRLFGTYGPAECTVMATYATAQQLQKNQMSVGSGLATNTWIVSTKSPGQLCGIGEVGELWLEGPLVGAGYLHEPEKTAAVFVEDPGFLRRDFPDHPGRPHQTFYQTGDLVRYLPDGTLEFMGRKDLQVKLRGQRVELGEIEWYLRQMLPKQEVSAVVVDVFCPEGSSNSTLAAAIVLSGQYDTEDEMQAALFKLTASLEKQMAEVLPAYMVPSTFLSFIEIPHTTTGKTDRNKLRQEMRDRCSSGSRHDSIQEEEIHLMTKVQTQLKELWVEILGLNDTIIIGANTSFVHLGGDSISAMRLVSAARKRGLALTVADILSHSRLEEQAACTTTMVSATTELDATSKKNPNAMELLPVTPFQKRALEGSTEGTIMWTDYYGFDLPPGSEIAQMEQVCTTLIQKLDILRTVFTKIQGTFYQTVLKSLELPLEVEMVEGNLDEASQVILQKDFGEPLEFGRAFFRMYLLVSEENQKRLVFRLNHAQMDGISLALLTSVLEALCAGRALPDCPSFSKVGEHICASKPESESYWLDMLKGASMTYIKARPDPTAMPVLLSQRVVSLPNSPDATPATVFTAASAFALAQISGESDLLFGRVVGGRGALPGDLQSAVGPCINFVPVRVRLAPDTKFGDVLQQIERQHMEGMSHEHVPFNSIRGDCCAGSPDEENDFGLVSVFQNNDAMATPAADGTAIKRSFLGMRPQIQRTNAVAFLATPLGGNQVHLLVTAKASVHGQESIDGMMAALCDAISTVE